MTAVHFDEREDAEAFVAVLADAGIDARTHRDEFAGEDDAEDAAWIVEVEAGPADLSDLAEGCGGWIVEAPHGPAAPLPPLPQEPRRLKNAAAVRRPADG